MTVLLTTILSILTVSITGILSIRWIRDATEKTLTEQLEINLKNIIQEKASGVEAKLQHYEKYIELATDSIADIYANEKEMISRGKMFFAPEDTREYRLTRAFASEELTEADLRDELLLFSNLEKVWGPIIKENEDLITTIYLGTKDGLLVSYDRYSYLSCPPEGKELVYNYYATEWFKRGMKEKNLLYTGVYMDSQGRGLTLTIASGFQDSKGETQGVVGIDFDLSALYEELFVASLEDGTFTFAIDHMGTIISPDSDTLDLREYTGLTLDELDELKADSDGIMSRNNAVYVCIPLKREGWTLFACTPMEAIQKSIHDADRSIWKAIILFLGMVLVILIASVFAVNKSVTAVTYPLAVLGRDIKIISDGDLNYRASVYRNDEIGDITSGMNEMVDRLNFTLNELMSSQQHADDMSRLALQDALTGVRNKTAFDEQTRLLEEELAGGEKNFGFVMLDLNNLKVINDNYGHEKGDVTIKKLCRIICEVFAHSPVFRVGGDEFVVLLKNEDYRNIQFLIQRFKNKIRMESEDKNASPWERVSAAVGYAIFDDEKDSGIESVLARADKEMYYCKKMMKGI